MDIDYEEYRAALEETYEDRCTISRYTKVKKPNGETKTELTTIYVDLSCRLSQKALATNGQTETVNNISYETKLFISPDIEIKQGDTFQVTRGRITANEWQPVAPERAYTGGEPFPYQTHQEVSLQRGEKA